MHCLVTSHVHPAWRSCVWPCYRLAQSRVVPTLVLRLGSEPSACLRFSAACTAFLVQSATSIRDCEDHVACLGYPSTLQPGLELGIFFLNSSTWRVASCSTLPYEGKILRALVAGLFGGADSAIRWGLCGWALEVLGSPLWALKERAAVCTGCIWCSNRIYPPCTQNGVSLCHGLPRNNNIVVQLIGACRWGSNCCTWVHDSAATLNEGGSVANLTCLSAPHIKRVR